MPLETWSTQRLEVEARAVGGGLERACELKALDIAIIEPVSEVPQSSRR